MKHYSKVILFILMLAFTILYSTHQENQQWNGSYYQQNSSPQYQSALACLSTITLKETDIVLDIGCGSGDISAYIASKVPKGYVLGIDSSPDMILQAKKHYNTLEHLHFEAVDATAVSKNNTFDYVFSFACLHWIEQQQKVIDNAACALKKGGILLISMTAKLPDNHPFIQALRKTTQAKKWKSYFAQVQWDHQWYPQDAETVTSFLLNAHLKPISVKVMERARTFANVLAFKKWIKGFMKGLPALGCLPEQDYDIFLDDVVEHYAHCINIQAHDSLTHYTPVLIAKAQK